MSLTNPKNVVTEERLNEYHQTILPYLGGMPDIMANKFNRSDLYSTDEKIIGQWIDGKPLYQKTIIYTTTSVGEVNTSFTLLSNITNLENVSFGIPTIQEPNSSNIFGNMGRAAYYNNAISLLMTQGTFASGSTIKLTLQYTKTTDSPVAIGSDTDYSTTEKIVGTWIDGKPIYQKTLTELSIALSWDSQYYVHAEVRPLISGVSQIISCTLYENEGSCHPCVVDLFDSNWNLCTLNGVAFTATKATLQYTKTTD